VPNSAAIVPAPFDTCVRCGSWHYTHRYADLAEHCPGFLSMAAGNPPEPLPDRTPTGKDRCFCGGGFVLVGKSKDVEHYECVLCELPIDRRMR